MDILNNVSGVINEFKHKRELCVKEWTLSAHGVIKIKNGNVLATNRAHDIEVLLLSL
jgi:hypothetical protein